jgi:HD-GYP domain-containing protein (c-di-GMP phosphodiesterase class II)
MLDSLKIGVSDLAIGMYVSALDKPWLETPFFTQGFLLECQEDIDKVREYCEFVYVDRRRSRKGLIQSRWISAAERPEISNIRRERPRVPIEKIFEGRKIQAYTDERSWQEEHTHADVALTGLLVDIAEIFDHVSDGGSLNVIQLRSAVAPIIQSMSRNPDACLWLTRLKAHDTYSYQHSVSAAIWAVALGRQLGLNRIDLRSLAVGGMLMDVGKLRIDPELLKASRDLTEEERVQVRQHVAFGVELLAESGMMNQDVIDMVSHHHERYDGSGYPGGLTNDHIPPFARIAGIVDTYDALTSARSYAQAISPSEAIRSLYQSRDEGFQAELVEAFIQAVGIYPAGTLVELSSGEVAVVVAEYRARRLLPRVSVLLNQAKERLSRPRMIDLLAGNSEAEEPLRIVKSLEPGAYGINLSEVAPEVRALSG